MKVLIVDDSPAQRFIQKSVLVENGVSDSDIIEAGNGLELLEKAKSEELKLIVVDWNMPEMDGLEAFKKLRQSGNDTPVIMITSEGEASKVEEAMNAGLDNFLTKPLDSDAFWEIAQRYM